MFTDTGHSIIVDRDLHVMIAESFLITMHLMAFISNESCLMFVSLPNGRRPKPPELNDDENDENDDDDWNPPGRGRENPPPPNPTPLESESFCIWLLNQMYLSVAYRRCKYRPIPKGLFCRAGAATPVPLGCSF